MVMPAISRREALSPHAAGEAMFAGHVGVALAIGRAFLYSRLESARWRAAALLAAAVFSHWLLWERGTHPGT
jgi:hypothetical protein